MARTFRWSRSDHRHRRLAPKTQVQSIGLAGDEREIGIASCRKLDLPAIVRLVGTQDEEPVAETTGGVDSVPSGLQARPVGDQRRLLLGKIDYLVAVEITIGEVEFVNDVVFAAA